jgi:hypothetical protein
VAQHTTVVERLACAAMAKTFRAFMDAYFTAEDLEDALGQLADHFRACQKQVASGEDGEADEAATDVFMLPASSISGPQRTSTAGALWASFGGRPGTHQSISHWTGAHRRC